jgi:SpoVK/Ycf46/Vps4 family AAA+-type ATPase
MFINEELCLLIKSRYPLVFFESIDELYAARQLKTIAEQLKLAFYHWSLTDGLRKGNNEGAYYQSKDPAMMLKIILNLLQENGGETAQSGLFVLKDFDRYLKDDLTLRLFKDAINFAKNTKNTFVILSAEYALPKDVEPDSARLIGGYPVEAEIEAAIKETIREFERTKQRAERSWQVPRLMNLNLKELKKMANALKGLSIQQIRNVINQCVLDDGILNIKALAAIESYKKKVFDQEGLLEFCVTEDKGNIAGFNNLKHWLAERRNSFIRDQAALLPVPRGLLLMGVQGCGKSLAVKVIAREWSLPLYRLDLARLYSKYIGETEQNLRKALAVVEKLCPLCLWIDEIEKAFAASGGEIDGGVSQRILGTFLTWMQERKAGCFIAATANDIYRLPPEFLRKGRFDEIFFADLPDAQAREQLFRIHIQKRGYQPDKFDIQKLAAESVDFSGAEIEQGIIAALYHASLEKEAIMTEHIVEQLRATKPLSVLKAEEITALRAWARERTIPV